MKTLSGFLVLPLLLVALLVSSTASGAPTDPAVPDPGPLPQFAQPIAYPYYTHSYISAHKDVNWAVGPYEDWHGGTNSYDQHSGTDYHTGQEVGKDVFASASGTVAAVVIDGRNTYPSGPIIYGTYVKISHGTLEDGYPYWTTYAHLSDNPPPSYSVGQQVSKGAKIGVSGNTGYSTGPHLHFEVRRNQDLKDYSICPYQSGILNEVY